MTFHGSSGGLGGLSMGSWVGFVTLFGITTRNTIMLLSHYEHLVVMEGEPWNAATAIRGASERLVLILIRVSSPRSAYYRWRWAAAKPAARSKAR